MSKPAGTIIVVEKKVDEHEKETEVALHKPTSPYKPLVSFPSRLLK